MPSSCQVDCEWYFNARFDPRKLFASALITVPFKGTETLAIHHPELGDLMAARDLLERCGYDMQTGTARRYLDMLGVPETERILINRSMVIGYDLSRFPNRGLIFLTRAGRNHVLMAPTKPEAKEFREWLAAEVVVVGRLRRLRVLYRE
ncbi:Bro-N domain-containing protein [Starkeya koreensis]|uniref:Bro-N domain-containing protein n=1 Tax=Ancylobacter koreensis TaxID=266121 RepID=A0ABT0DS15_9HYPH|nr:Bro-N domain-containing protein [Ancylobacter koreensis]MCK0210063.1 Bro-N domain-containing protein [Ancylobacter koreensis]